VGNRKELAEIGIKYINIQNIIKGAVTSWKSAEQEAPRVGLSHKTIKIKKKIH
jgi:hypothetical protein